MGLVSTRTGRPVARSLVDTSQNKTTYWQLPSCVHSVILFRDLKLSNLLYSNTGQLKLCDFGLARCVEFFCIHTYDPGSS